MNVYDPAFALRMYSHVLPGLQRTQQRGWRSGCLGTQPVITKAILKVNIGLFEKDLCPVAGRGGYSLRFAEVQPCCILNAEPWKRRVGYAAL